jgi:Zn-dependent peptidase ImmA (M78 family)/DNA-binding XRE family transcriptional regulator
MIGQRLKLARAAAGLSLRGLAEKIGNLVTAQAIGKYERDEAMPSSRVLIALARALDVSEDYLVGDREVVLEGIEFRKKSIASRKEEAQVEAKALHLLERYLLVEELLGLASVDWDRPREAPYPVLDLPEADRAARSLRQHWGLGTDPIPNLVELVEERGIKVLILDLAQSIDGLTGRARRAGKGAAPVVVVNSRHSGERQRFTLAHELGHMTIQAGRGVDAEKAAHRFAGAFLMPVEAIWAEIGKHRRSIGWGELFDLKRLFGVSVQAITYRCKDLGIFGEGLYRQLFGEFSRRGWRSPPFPEPHPIPPEEPRRFERLCLRALAEGAISEAKAAELLGMSVRRLSELMEDPQAEQDTELQPA